MAAVKSREYYAKAGWIFHLAGIVLCVLPTLIAAFFSFPKIVSTKTETTLSGCFLTCLIIAIYPLFKLLVTKLKSPSAAVVTWIAFAVLSLISKMNMDTINALKWVFFVAAIGNTVGLLLFKISAHMKEKALLVGSVKVEVAK